MHLPWLETEGPAEPGGTRGHRIGRKMCKPLSSNGPHKLGQNDQRGTWFCLCVKPIASVGKEQRHDLCMSRCDCLRLRRFASHPLARHAWRKRLPRWGVIYVCPALAQESFFTVSPDSSEQDLDLQKTVQPEVLLGSYTGNLLGSHSALQQQCAEWMLPELSEKYGCVSHLTHINQYPKDPWRGHNHHFRMSCRRRLDKRPLFPPF